MSPPPQLVVATTNRHKLQEIRRLLAASPVDIVSLDAFPPLPEPEETGTTFEENARIKARFYERATGVMTVAEDSGLVIDALDDEPGVRSARFVRPDATYADRFAEVYRRMSAAPERGRNARFVCALTVVRDGEIVFETSATIEGEIAATPKGTGGFGYDPIFYYPPYAATLAEVSQFDKLTVAHRGQAFRALAKWLDHVLTAE